MTKNRKYSYKIEQEGSTWNAQITRQITSKKVIVSKEQEAFVSEADAKEWAEQQLLEFATTLGTRNLRHSEQRKLGEEGKQQRSARRSEKTRQTKQEKTDREQESTSSTDNDADIASESDYHPDEM